RDPTLTLLRSLIDVRIIRRRVMRRILLSQHPRNRRSQRRLPMVDVTHRPDVHMRLSTLELLFGHGVYSPVLLLGAVGAPTAPAHWGVIGDRVLRGTAW